MEYSDKKFIDMKCIRWPGVNPFHMMTVLKTDRDKEWLQYNDSAVSVSVIRMLKSTVVIDNT